MKKTQMDKIMGEFRQRCEGSLLFIEYLSESFPDCNKYFVAWLDGERIARFMISSWFSQETWLRDKINKLVNKYNLDDKDTLFISRGTGFRFMDDVMTVAEFKEYSILLDKRENSSVEEEEEDKWYD